MTIGTQALLQRLLLWILPRDHTGPRPEDFLSSKEGHGVSETGLQDVLRDLVDYELIENKIRVEESDTPVVLKLTSAGRICARDYGGDVEAYRRSRMPSFLDQSTTVHAGRDAQVAAHSPHATMIQNSTVNVEKLVAAAESTRQALSGLQLSPDQEEAVLTTVDEIVARAAEPDPDSAALAGLGQKLISYLPQALPLGQMLIEAVLAALGG